jgi:hypothetical protein
VRLNGSPWSMVDLFVLCFFAHQKSDAEPQFRATFPLFSGGTRFSLFDVTFKLHQIKMLFVPIDVVDVRLVVVE